MPTIAVIKTGGKQYKVAAGQELKVEKLAGEPGSKVNIETLLIADENGEIKEIGAPSLGEKVSAEIIETGKGKKVSVVKFKSKVRYRRKVGHRQIFTKIKIAKID
jgi:large subunit ribosomal protein L21